MPFIIAPLGLDAPVLRVINEMALQVAWSAPKQPNGQVTGYYLYKDGQQIDPQMTLAGSFIIYDLLPFTVYAIQVCTMIYLDTRAK